MNERTPRRWQQVTGWASVLAAAAVWVGCGGEVETGAPGNLSPVTTEATQPAVTTGTVPTGDTDRDDGRAVFVTTCQGCHPAAGTAEGVGPRLADRGVSAARVRDQVTNGGGDMPAGLVAGDDLAAVVAYVVSIQGVTGGTATGASDDDDDRDDDSGRGGRDDDDDDDDSSNRGSGGGGDSDDD